MYEVKCVNVEINVVGTLNIDTSTSVKVNPFGVQIATHHVEMKL